MTDSLYDTQAYNYPMLDDDTRIKIAKLRQSIARLEANLLTPDSVAKNANTDHNFNNNPILEQSSVDYAGELNQSQLLAATTIKGKVLVIAGAGSGKTKTLTYRTSYLIEVTQP